MTITDKLIAGDTLDFVDLAPSGFEASAGWTLRYRLAPRFTDPVQAPIQITAAPYETDHYRIQVGSSTTATWAAGAYNWARWVEQIGMRMSLGEGEIQIMEDPAQRAAGYDGRTHTQKVLAQIEAAIEGLNYGVKSYAIGGRIWTKEDLSELIKLQQWYQQRANDESVVTSSGSGSRMMRVRYSRG
jgi:hypothetical protein